MDYYKTKKKLLEKINKKYYLYEEEDDPPKWFIKTVALMTAFLIGSGSYYLYKKDKYYPYENEIINFDKIVKHERFKDLNCSKEKILELKRKIFHGGSKYTIGYLTVCLTKNKDKLIKKEGLYLDPFIPYLHFANSQYGFFNLNDFKIEIFLKERGGKSGDRGIIRIINEKNKKIVEEPYIYTKNVDYCLYSDKKKGLTIKECNYPWNSTY